MEKLDEYTEKSFKDGLFVVRNRKEPYGGVSPDLAIEQKLMAPLKGHGGLTRGRGMTESTRTQWLLSRSVFVRLKIKMDEISESTKRSYPELSQDRLKKDIAAQEQIE